MHRRQFLASLGAPVPASLMRADPFGAQRSSADVQAPTPKADFTLRIAPASFEIAPRKVVKTVAYNGSVPGPLLRMSYGKPVGIDVFNDTGDADIVHWHGLHIPGDVDGSMEEGTPMLPAHGSARYTFTPAPSGTPRYHSHVMAGRNLKRATYTGQFGFIYIEPHNEPGNYDREVFLALKEWDPYLSSGVDDDSIDVACNFFSVNDRPLGHGEPIRVKEGQRVLLRILNASATVTRRIAVAGHRFRVVAMDGNAVATPEEVQVLELGPTERLDAFWRSRSRKASGSPDAARLVRWLRHA
jgi:FtsP/CotA-like multicopper oxidase with cupredoxin domain